MGSAIPIAPVLGKWYHCKVHTYLPGWGENGCVGADLGYSECCQGGGSVITFINNNYRCNKLCPNLCLVWMGSAKRLVWIIGPYDTQAECAEWLP